MLRDPGVPTSSNLRLNPKFQQWVPQVSLKLRDLGMSGADEGTTPGFRDSMSRKPGETWGTPVHVLSHHLGRMVITRISVSLTLTGPSSRLRYHRKLLQRHSSAELTRPRLTKEIHAGD